jgi:UDP:flavonoid glycosyltransferase YjiC (YdhE family)
VVRSLALADELKSRGHTVLFTSSKAKRAFVEQAGFSVYGASHPDLNLNDENDQGIGYFTSHRHEFMEWFRDEIAAAEDFRPDVIVNSPTFFGAIAAKKTRIPHVTVVNGNWLPSFRGVLGLGRCDCSLGHDFSRRMMGPLLARGFDRVYLAQIQGWYDELGVGPLPTTRSDLHKGLPALIPGIPILEPVERESAHFIGPLHWTGFDGLSPGGPSLFTDTSRPRIYVTLGGSVFRKESYRELMEAFAARDDWDTVMSLGPNIPRDALPADLPHLKVRQYVPGLDACRWADVVVNTASHGTIMQALSFGKPMVLIPRNIDQSTFAARLQELGAAENLNRMSLKAFTKREAYVESANRITGDRIVQAAERVFQSKSLRGGAMRLSEEVARFPDGARRGADLIQEVVRNCA